MLSTKAVSHPADKLLGYAAKLAAICYIGPTASEITETLDHAKDCPACMETIRKKGLDFVKSFCQFGR